MIPGVYNEGGGGGGGEIIEGMVNASRNVVIETLPFFNISNTSYIHSPCMLFAQDAPIMGQPEVTRTGFNTYLTGAYKVMGYVHSIRAGHVTSKFTLVKPTVDLGEEEEEVITETIIEEKPDNVTQEQRQTNSTPEPNPAESDPAVAHEDGNGWR